MHKFGVKKFFKLSFKVGHFGKKVCCKCFFEIRRINLAKKIKLFCRILDCSEA